ncbi:Ribonucleases P/MRP protein subunit POP1 [Pseudolycoriella hygida]|uniref:Ribonucleases P/MRP protein subunit POP1 n=1 Tax=Pseudolycoriella hygida TaxID=35572 RepID=A0A9Q0MIF9_9DIPT|nr:Ribonucleases P/MRP protein subunit POP1 [Pseudolycoriella hygida]
MTTEKLEYDAAIGGTVELPDSIQTYKYVGDRVAEIQTMFDAIDNPNQTKLVFQALPRHMRRRAMSHCPKRLPRKYRHAHVSQMRKSGVPSKTKRPSRKYRRKPNNLLKEYVRRQRKNIWMETHIWHAKRFHMINRWGYRLAEFSCDKTFRSSFRASAKYCLLQDMSHIGCIEIVGNVETISNGFERLTSRRCNRAIAAKMYLSGKRHGSVNLFKIDSYPMDVLGNVTFIWKPVESTGEVDDDRRTLWIFVHASFYEDVVNEISSVFDLTEVGYELEKSDKMVADSMKIRQNINLRKNEALNIELKELKNQLNYFRLTGPLSQAVLSNAFKCKTNVTSSSNASWFDNFLSTEIGALAHNSQMNYWSGIHNVNSPSELCPNMVLTLNIEDPRINRPKKRTQAIPANESQITKRFNDCTLEIPEFSSVSQIWDHNVRDLILKSKMSTHELCTKRNEEALVPGERCSFEDSLQAIPVLLMQRPGCLDSKFKRLGYGCGWDVIVPAGYGISTWMCLIMWGARAGGLRESETVSRESGFDEFEPDTLTGIRNSEDKYHELRERYFKLPQNKRPNYNKLSINSPFKCLWSQLVKEWSTQNSDDVQFYVLRDPIHLQMIQKSIDSCSPIKSIDFPTDCLIPVTLTMDSRGTLENNSHICLPKPIDLKRDSRKKRNFDKEPVFEEALQVDKNENERKLLRTNHIKLLKRLRRRRVRVKRRKQETSEKRVLIAKPATAKLIRDQMNKMRELWLPENPTTVRNQCSREVIGFVTFSNFSFIEAKVTGIGYIALNSLEKLVKNCGKSKGNVRVMVRSTNSRQYRLAKVKVKV